MCLFQRDITALYSQTPSVSSVALSAFIKNRSLFDHVIVLQHMLQSNILGERHIPTDVKRKRDTESRWKSEKPLWDCTVIHARLGSAITHARMYFSMQCWLWVSQWMWWKLVVLAQEKDSHVCQVTLRSCYSPERVHSNFAPSWCHTSEKQHVCWNI